MAGRAEHVGLFFTAIVICFYQFKMQLQSCSLQRRSINEQHFTMCDVQRLVTFSFLYFGVREKHYAGCSSWRRR